MMPDGTASPQTVNQWQIIAGIEKSQIQISSALTSIMDRLESVEKKVSDSSNIPWGAISASSTIIIAILGGFIALLAVLGSTSVENLDNKLVTMSQLVVSHQTGGHPGNLDEKISALVARNVKFEQALDHVVPREEHAIKDKFVNERFEADEKRFLKHVSDATRIHDQTEMEINRRFEEARSSLARSDDQLFHRIERIEDYMMKEKRAP